MDLTSFALELLARYGPLALCLFVFLETSMLFPFLPSEVVVPAAAALLVTDPASLVVFVTAAGVGGTAGAYVPYAVFLGRIDADSWVGRRLDVTDAQVDRGRTWFRRWGESSVLWGRFLPVLRSVISVPAGLAQMDPVRFGALTALGTVGFYAATGVLVYYGRQQPFVVAAVDLATDRPAATAVLVLGVVGIAVVLGRWLGRRNRV